MCFVLNLCFIFSVIYNLNLLLVFRMQKACNSSSIAINFERQALKYDKLYRKRAFVHWLYGEGLESGDGSESREDIAALIRDYEEFAIETVEGEEI